MRLSPQILIAAAALLFVPTASAQPAPHRAAPQIQARGLTDAEAKALLAKVADAQAKVKKNDPVVFELLSGAPALYPMARVAPRDAFLRLPLAKTFSVERKATDNKLWQPYRIIVLPDGPGKLLWDVEVVLGVNGQIERIEMLYRPPAPF